MINEIKREISTKSIDCLIDTYKTYLHFYKASKQNNFDAGKQEYGNRMLELVGYAKIVYDILLNELVKE